MVLHTIEMLLVMVMQTVSARESTVDGGYSPERASIPEAAVVLGASG